MNSLRLIKNLLFVVIVVAQRITYMAAQFDTTSYKFNEDSIIVEKFDYENTDETRLNTDNVIYRPGRNFVFDYHYENKAGTKYHIKRGSLIKDGIYDWDFTPLNNKDSNTVEQIVMTINPGLEPFIEDFPDYNETVISYFYKLTQGNLIASERTGLIENPHNICFHPPRTNLFKILKLNPYPYIKQPISVGINWTWKLTFGDYWADRRWKVWSGLKENKYKYKVSASQILKTPLGVLKCFVVESEATSDLGTTKLTSYFNNEFGFIKLDYLNIDGSKLIFELKSMD
jgi:hypothetical protein